MIVGVIMGNIWNFEWIGHPTFQFSKPEPLYYFYSTSDKPPSPDVKISPIFYNSTFLLVPKTSPLVETPYKDNCSCFLTGLLALSIMTFKLLPFIKPEWSCHNPVYPSPIPLQPPPMVPLCQQVTFQTY